MSDIDRMSRGKLVSRIRELEEETDKVSRQVDIDRDCSVIGIPEGMTYQEAITWIQRKEQEEETIVQINHSMQCHPLDGSLALLKAIQRTYGWAELRATPGFWGDSPPTMVTLPTSTTESIQVPWGRLAIPGIDGYIGVSLQQSDGTVEFIIFGEVKQKHAHVVKQLATLTEKIVNEESIYRGKAISIDLAWARAERDFNPNTDGFRFMELSDVKPSDLIFDRTTEQILQTGLFSFIQNAAKCRERGIPLKRGCLLEGSYGVGKTLTAQVTAKIAIDNGFTFILAENVKDLGTVVEMSRRYEPVVIFVEDIDRSMGGKRTISMDQILNIVDGVESKGREVMIVMTTNDVESINKAMLRPGRLDVVISLKSPDAEAITRLFQLYAHNQIEEGANLMPAAEKLEGSTPAVVREVIERAKMASIVRDDSEVITGEDLMISAESMKRHLELLVVDPNKNADTPMDLIKTLGHTLGEHMYDTAVELNGK